MGDGGLFRRDACFLLYRSLARVVEGNSRDVDAGELETEVSCL